MLLFVIKYLSSLFLVAGLVHIQIVKLLHVVRLDFSIHLKLIEVFAGCCFLTSVLKWLAKDVLVCGNHSKSMRRCLKIENLARTCPCKIARSVTLLL